MPTPTSSSKDDTSPLSGKRLLFTTPRNYAAPLSSLFISRGARPVWLPSNQIRSLADYAELDNALRRLDKYDWVAFTSENGVEAFCRRLAALGLKPGTGGSIRLAAFRWDAAGLEKAGFRVDLIPAESSTIGMVDEFRKRGILKGRVLAPVPQVEGAPEPPIIPEFIRGLKDLGLEATRVPAYITLAKVSDGEAELEWLRRGNIDAVVFTSSSEIYALLDWLGKERELLDRVPCAYLGRIILDTARREKLRLDIVQDGTYTFAALVDKIEGFFSRQVSGTGRQRA